MDSLIKLAKIWRIISTTLAVSLLVNPKFYIRLVNGFENEAMRSLYFFYCDDYRSSQRCVHEPMENGSKGTYHIFGVGVMRQGGSRYPDARSDHEDHQEDQPESLLGLLVWGCVVCCGAVFAIYWFWRMTLSSRSANPDRPHGD